MVPEQQTSYGEKLATSIRWRSVSLTIGLAAVSLFPFAFGPQPAPADSDPRGLTRISHEASTAIRSGAAFLENLGQLEARSVEFYAERPDFSIAFTKKGVLLRITRGVYDGISLDERNVFDSSGKVENSKLEVIVLRLEFVGSNAPRPRGLDVQERVSNFLLGDEPSR
jgi:hypothetical protein